MHIRSTFSKIVLISLFLGGSWVTGAASLPEGALAQGRYRMDFTFVGNDQQQDVYLKGMQWDKAVSVPSAQFIPDYDYGEYQLAVVDSASQQLLYKQGFSALFFEWRTTLQAKVQDAAYDQSVFIPAFSQAIQICIYERNKENGQYVELAKWNVNSTKNTIPLQATSSYQHTQYIYHGDSDHKVDLVFLAEGYTLQDQEKYRQDVARMVTELFKTEPYASHIADFNVWIVDSYSLESGTTIPHEGIYKNTAFSSSFNALQIQRYLMIDNQTAVMKALAGVPCDAVYVLVNTAQYGGGGIYNFYGMSASDCRKSTTVFVHEFGHSFAGLADEYFESTTSYNDFYSLTAEPWEPNVTNFVQFDKKWKDLLKAKTPIPTPVEDKLDYPVGAYEGAAYVAKGMFRPSFDCRMRTNEAPGFCPVCNRSIERMIQFYCR